MHQITINDITIDVIHKNIKNLHLAVYPPTGRVRIAAPLTVNDDAIRLFAISKLAWIKKHKKQFDSQERQSIREYISGESHYYQGKRYLLNVINNNDTCKVVIRNKLNIDLYVPDDADYAQRQYVMTEWYRQQMKNQILPLLDKWKKYIGVDVTDCRVKQMKTKWGSCNIPARRIWLNLELIKKPAHCLEYIIVHEMVHLLERRHNDRFILYMDKFMPQWRSYKDELNKFILGYAEWGYC